MATGTLGTNATTSFTALRFQPSLAAADLATINAAIHRDNNPANNSTPVSVPTALSTSGILELPGGRGNVYLKPGDVVAVDPNTGWPIVISQNCSVNGAVTTTA